MFNQADLELIDYINRIKNSGATKVEIPNHLIENASDKGIEEVRRMCKLAGIEIIGIA